MTEADTGAPEDHRVPWIRGGWGVRSPAFGVLFLGTLLSIAAGWLATGLETQRRAADSAERVEVYAQALGESLQQRVSEVQVLAQFFDASDTVTADEFPRFTRPLLQRQPRLSALEWVPRVRADERAQFEAQAQREGLAQFSIREGTPGNLHPAGPRPEYFPVYRIEPPTGNAPALGLDLGSEPQRRAALERARDTGRPAITAPLTLVQETGGQRALAIFVPLIARDLAGDTPHARRDRLHGFAVGLLRVGDLVEGTLAALPPTGLDLVLRDADLPGDAGLLDVHPSRLRADGARPDLAALARDPLGHEVRLAVAGRTLALRGTPPPGTPPASVLGVAIGGLGLAISAALAALVRYRRATAARLSASEERLRLATDAGQIGLFDWDIATGRIAWSQHHERLWGLAPGTFDGTFATFASRVHPEDLPGLSADLARCMAQRTRHAREFRVLWPDGTAHWIAGRGEFSFDPAGQPVRMCGTVMEITEGRRALEAERAQLEARVAARTAQLHASEGALRTLTERLQLATEAGGIGVWEWDMVKDRIYWDDQVYRLHGRPPATDAHLTYADWAAGVHPVDLPPLQTTFAAILEGRDAAFRTSFRIDWPDGTLHYIASSGRVIRDAAGVAQRLIGVNWDITAERHAQLALEASEARARAVIDASPVPQVLAHETGPTHYLNAAFTETFGYTLADIPTWSDWRIKACPDAAYRDWVMTTRQERLRQAERGAGPFAPLEVRVHCKDGTVRTVIARTTPLGGEERLNTIYDITDLKQAREQAEQAALGQAEFLAHMSHEIRTPMNGIVGLSELALYEPLEPRARDYLEKIHQSSRSLLGILNDILDHSRIAAGRLNLAIAPFDLNGLLTTLGDLFAHAATAKGLRFTIAVAPDVPRWLLGDALRLQQVFSNLLGNAVKFTERGQVSLQIARLECDAAAARLRCTVQDSGIGMDAATQARLFQPFTQGDSSIARRFGGSGLGLSISRRLVGLMDGELGVASAPGMGSTFTVELCLGVAATPPGGAATPAPSATTLTGARVLVAEDQPINQQVIGDMLRLLGVRVTLANDGREALEHLAAAPFDAILMDIQMPTLDGLTATRQIRATPAWCDLPVIALTAGVTDAERDRIAACGMTDLLPKPVTMEALTAILGRWLGPPTATAPVPPAALPVGPHPAPGGATPGVSLALPGFDLRLLHQTCGDAAGVIGLLRRFADSIRDDAEAIAAAVTAGETAQAGQRVHRLKGTAGNLGARDLHAAAVQLEADLQAGQDPGPALAAVRATHAAALARIAALPVPAAATGPVSAAGTPAAVRPLATAIRAHLTKGLFVPPALVADLGAALPAREQALYQALKRHLEQFDYRAAARLLEPLLAVLPALPDTDHER